MGVESTFRRDVRTKKAPADLADLEYFKKICDKQADIGRKIAFLLNTGNLVSTSGLDLMQTSGFTVVADKINYMRFLTHFRRCVTDVVFALVIFSLSLPLSLSLFLSSSFAHSLLT